MVEKIQVIQFLEPKLLKTLEEIILNKYFHCPSGINTPPQNGFQ